MDLVRDRAYHEPIASASSGRHAHLGDEVARVVGGELAVLLRLEVRWSRSMRACRCLPVQRQRGRSGRDFTSPGPGGKWTARCAPMCSTPATTPAVRPPALMRSRIVAIVASQNAAPTLAWIPLS